MLLLLLSVEVESWTEFRRKIKHKQKFALRARSAARIICIPSMPVTHTQTDNPTKHKHPPPPLTPSYLARPYDTKSMSCDATAHFVHTAPLPHGSLRI